MLQMMFAGFPSPPPWVDSGDFSKIIFQRCSKMSVASVAYHVHIWKWMNIHIYMCIYIYIEYVYIYMITLVTRQTR